MRLFALLISGLLAAGWGFGQTAASARSSASARTPTLDKAALEAYLRYLNLYRGSVTYKIDDPKPSKDVPGFSEVGVHLSFENGSKDELYYVSADGKTILEADVYHLNQNPFQANLDKLKLAGAPSFGPANAPLTIV
jgi:hypothetical protein